MARVERSRCIRCNRPIRVIRSGPPTRSNNLCDDCESADNEKKQEKEEKKWLEHLEELQKLSLEERLQRVEHWMFKRTTLRGYHVL